MKHLLSVRCGVDVELAVDLLQRSYCHRITGIVLSELLTH
jgi:hypothetical protein